MNRCPKPVTEESPPAPTPDAEVLVALLRLCNSIDALLGLPRRPRHGAKRLEHGPAAPLKGALLLLALLPLPALAAPGADLGLGVGAAMFSGPSEAGSVTVGPALKVELAVELHERVSLSLFALGSAHRGGSGLAGGGAAPGGDLTALTPGLSARLNALGFDDALGARRLWLYARAGVGWTLWWPSGQLASGGPLLLAALGVEYRAHLKGFSVGLEVAPFYAPARGAFGGAVMPNLRFEL